MDVRHRTEKKPLTFPKWQVRELTSKKVLFHSLERSTREALLSKPLRGHFMSTQRAFTLQSCNYKFLHVNKNTSSQIV